LSVTPTRSESVAVIDVSILYQRGAENVATPIIVHAANCVHMLSAVPSEYCG
ncbi:Hypothetical predicted protein, partial [Podarcis lilfordi]